MSSDYKENRYVRFYKDRVDVGREGYNPQRITYYNSSDELIKVREVWRGEIWEQTISGTTSSGIIDQTIDHVVYFDSWVKINI